MRKAALILAGGKSSRFGSDKSQLTICGERIVDRLVGHCRELCDEVLISCGEREKFWLPGVREVPDRLPGRGPLSGIHAGMQASNAQMFLVLACDMPLFAPDLARLLFAQCETGYDACVPFDGTRLQPLCAVYRRTALPVIQQLLEEGENRMGMLLSRMQVCRLECPECSSSPSTFWNINTPADYAYLVGGGL